jgi:Bacterial SH3 domain
MRAGWIVIAAAALLSGCDTTGGGVFGSVMGQVGNGAANNVLQRTVGAVATSVPVTNMTRELCGSDQWGLCHNATATILAGFSDEFIKRMTEEDVRQATDARDKSLRDGQPQVWSNPASGASGTVATKPAQTIPAKPTPVTVQSGRVDVTALPAMDAVGEPYQVVSAKGANVRDGPGVGYSIVETLKPKDAVTAIAKVRDQDWYMIGRGNVGIGYVFASLVGPRNFAAQVAPVDAAVPVQQVEVDMASECYTTTQRVTLKDGTSEEAQVTSCRTPSGWAQV